MDNRQKPIIMLHYSQYGVQRSPNTQFDILRSNEKLSEKFQFVTLNQEEPPSIKGHIKSIFCLAKEIRRVKPYAIHIIGIKEGFHCTLAAFVARCPKRILVTHGFAGLSSKNNSFRRFCFQQIIEPITLILATKVQCNSYFSYNQKLIERFASKKRVVIYNFLQTPLFSTSDIWRQTNHLNMDDFVITTIGNMHEGKGYDILIKVIKHYSLEENIKFVIIGEGTLRETIVSALDCFINKGKVIYLGQVSHESAMQVLSESDVFFLPTRFESLGMVFAEAGYLGIPCIGTNVGAVPEIIKHMETGMLIENGDSNSAIEFINLLMNNRVLGKNMGMAAKKHIKNLFSEDIITKSIINIYKS